MFGVALLLMAGAALISANPVDVQAQDPSAVLSSVEELVQSLKEVVEGDKVVQQELLRAVQSLGESQASLQQVIAGSNEIDLDATTTGTTEGGEPVSNIAFFTRHVVAALTSGNNTQLDHVIKELKTLNTAFGGYFKKLACPDPFIPIGDECFNFLLEDLPWEDAKQRCGTLGAALAEPKNITEVRLYINVNFPRKSRRNFWIGGVNNNKVWEWLSGTPLPNDLWYTNEPSGNGECLAMFDGWDRPLTDFPCENPRRAVCEKRTTWEPTSSQ